MKFEILWSAFAESQIDAIFNYYTHKLNKRTAKRLIKKIISEPNKLIQNPDIGQIEELLSNRNEEYRYLICKNYKIIYSIDKQSNSIKIADVFDTRQNPIVIKRTK